MGRECFGARKARRVDAVPFAQYLKRPEIEFGQRVQAFNMIYVQMTEQQVNRQIFFI